MSNKAEKILVLATEFEKQAASSKKVDPKAKVRNRGTVCVPAENAKDKKDHFPINNEAQARNALARVNQFSKVPDWYNGSLQGLVSLVARKVKAKYPSIEVSKDSKKPGKKKAYIEQYDSIIEKFAQMGQTQLSEGGEEMISADQLPSGVMESVQRLVDALDKSGTPASKANANNLRGFTGGSPDRKFNVTYMLNALQNAARSLNSDKDFENQQLAQQTYQKLLWMGPTGKLPDPTKGVTKDVPGRDGSGGAQNPPGGPGSKSPDGSAGGGKRKPGGIGYRSDVFRAQQRLTKSPYGFQDLEVDGLLGPQTRAMLKSYKEFGEKGNGTGRLSMSDEDAIKQLSQEEYKLPVDTTPPTDFTKGPTWGAGEKTSSTAIFDSLITKYAQGANQDPAAAKARADSLLQSLQAINSRGDLTPAQVNEQAQEIQDNAWRNLQNNPPLITNDQFTAIVNAVSAKKQQTQAPSPAPITAPVTEMVSKRAPAKPVPTINAQVQRDLNFLGFVGRDFKPLADDGKRGPNTDFALNSFKNSSTWKGPLNISDNATPDELASLVQQAADMKRKGQVPQDDTIKQRVEKGEPVATTGVPATETAPATPAEQIASNKPL